MVSNTDISVFGLYDTTPETPQKGPEGDFFGPKANLSTYRHLNTHHLQHLVFLLLCTPTDYDTLPSRSPDCRTGAESVEAEVPETESFGWNNDVFLTLNH